MMEWRVCQACQIIKALAPDEVMCPACCDRRGVPVGPDDSELADSRHWLGLTAGRAVPSPEDTPQADRDRSIAHLADTVKIEQAHAQRHLQAAMDADSPESLKFNHEHLAHHLGEAQLHVGKLLAHLAAHYPEVGKEIGALDAASEPGAP